jgi:hypothetical protein
MSPDLPSKQHTLADLFVKAGADEESASRLAAIALRHEHETAPAVVRLSDDTIKRLAQATNNEERSWKITPDDIKSFFSNIAAGVAVALLMGGAGRTEPPPDPVPEVQNTYELMPGRQIDFKSLRINFPPDEQILIQENSDLLRNIYNNPANIVCETLLSSILERYQGTTLHELKDIACLDYDPEDSQSGSPPSLVVKDPKP